MTPTTPPEYDRPKDGSLLHGREILPPVTQSAPAQSAVPPAARLRVNVTGRVTFVSATCWRDGRVLASARGVLLRDWPPSEARYVPDDLAVERLLGQVGVALEDVGASWDDL